MNKNKFKKGQVVTFTANVELTLYKNEGVVLGKSKRFPNTYRVRFRSPLLLKRGKKTVRGWYETVVKDDSMMLDTIATLKSIMRR